MSVICGLGAGVFRVVSQLLFLDFLGYLLPGNQLPVSFSTWGFPGLQVMPFQLPDPVSHTLIPGVLRVTSQTNEEGTVSLQSPCTGRHCCDPPFIEIASLFEFGLYVGILVSTPHLVLYTKSHFLFLDVGSPWLLG